MCSAAVKHRKASGAGVSGLSQIGVAIPAFLAGIILVQIDTQLPDKAPVNPRRPRRVLVLGRAEGYVHSSIPLAARTIEEMGRKTGAWSTTITYWGRCGQRSGNGKS